MLIDLTYIKELESKSKQIRNNYFASVSHELRTPLNSILPMAEQLKKYVSGLKGTKCLNIIIGGATHLTYVVEDVMEMTRIE